MQVAITISSSDVAALTVYDEYGNWLGYIWNQSGRSSSDAISLEAGKDYYIEVSSPYADFGASVDYDVTIERYIPKIVSTYYDGYYGDIKGDAGNDYITFAGACNTHFSTIDLGDGNDIIDIQDSYYYWDGNEVECFEVENLDGMPGTISLGNGDDQIIVGKTRELEAMGIDMGSGNDEIILKADSMLELNLIQNGNNISGGQLVFGDGNDRLILEAGNEWETELCCAGIDFGNDDDYCEIGANNQVDVYGAWNFGSGDDTLIIEEGSLVCLTDYRHDLDFGAGNDTLEINGVLSLSGGTISGCENFSGSGEVVFSGMWNIDNDLEEKLLDAGINIIDGQGYSGCMGTVAELADNDPFLATDLHDVEVGDWEDFWLCGSSIAAESQYGLADPVDYYIFDKDYRSEALEVYAYGDSLSIEILDINGNKTGYELMSDGNFGYKSDVTTWNDGRYLIKLSVNSNSATNGSIRHIGEED